MTNLSFRAKLFPQIVQVKALFPEDDTPLELFDFCGDSFFGIG